MLTIRFGGSEVRAQDGVALKTRLYLGSWCGSPERLVDQMLLDCLGAGYLGGNEI